MTELRILGAPLRETNPGWWEARTPLGTVLIERVPTQPSDVTRWRVSWTLARRRHRVLALYPSKICHTLEDVCHEVNRIFDGVRDVVAKHLDTRGKEVKTAKKKTETLVCTGCGEPFQEGESMFMHRVSYQAYDALSPTHGVQGTYHERCKPEDVEIHEGPLEYAARKG